MGLLDYFRSARKNTAAVAKDRLQIIVAHERTRRNSPHYLAELEREILAVVRKYVAIEPDQVKVTVDRDSHTEVLELSITLPEPTAR